MKIEFFRHSIDRVDKENLLKVLDSIFLSTGETVATFEKHFANYLHAKYAVGVMSCTAALHLCLLALGIGKGDEVITTPMSFIATANSIEHVNAKPIFVDVERTTGNIDVNKIELAITKRTKAIIPVHLYGQMCDMKAISRIAKKHRLAVIEDAAHAIEAERDGIKPGQLSDAACFSFYATKNITCGEGGAIVTNNKKLAEQCKILRLHGMTKSAADRYTKFYKHYDMAVLGWKYNLSNIQASLLIHQLKKLNERWEKRKQIVMRYENAFRNISQLDLLNILPEVHHAYHLYTILVPQAKRDDILHALQKKGIGVAVNFNPIHLMRYYRKKYGYQAKIFPVAEEIGSRTISLPLYPHLIFREQKYIIDAVCKIINQFFL